MLYSILVSIDVLLAIGIIGMVLMQQGKGASVGAAFGGGASGTVFGSRGSSSFLTRATAILVTLFFINSLGLAYLASHRPVAESVIDSTSEIYEGVPSLESIPGEEARMPQVGKMDNVGSSEVESGAASSVKVDNMKSTSKSEEITPDDIPE